MVDRAHSEQVFTDWDEVDRFTDTFLQEAATLLKHPRSLEADKRRAMSQLVASIAQRVRHGRQQA